MAPVAFFRPFRQAINRNKVPCKQGIHSENRFSGIQRIERLAECRSIERGRIDGRNIVRPGIRAIIQKGRIVNVLVECRQMHRIAINPVMYALVTGTITQHGTHRMPLRNMNNPWIRVRHHFCLGVLV